MMEFIDEGRVKLKQRFAAGKDNEALMYGSRRPRSFNRFGKYRGPIELASA